MNKRDKTPKIKRGFLRKNFEKNTTVSSFSAPLTFGAMALMPLLDGGVVTLPLLFGALGGGVAGLPINIYMGRYINGRVESFETQTGQKLSGPSS